MRQVKRFPKKERRNIQIPQPFAIGQYNSSMGGTDLMDENINRHRISMGEKKWWWNWLT